MREQGGHNSLSSFLSAQWGVERVTIGVDPPERLRQLSDTRQLTCPGCGATVVLHAGTVRTHHFAHLPGAVCTAPQSEPETEEHRAGKLLLAQWLRLCLPSATVLLEAHIPETNQRADILILPDRDKIRHENRPSPAEIRWPARIALEYQCAALSAKEWRRRHHLYRTAGIPDLWLLGGSRLIHESLSDNVQSPNTPSSQPNTPIPTNTPNTPNTHEYPTPQRPTPNASIRLRTTELERALLWDGAPLLFLDSIGIHLPASRLARFRPEPDAQAMRPTGRLDGQPLLTLPFPHALLAWPDRLHPDTNPDHQQQMPAPHQNRGAGNRLQTTDHQLWNWLIQRHRVTPETLNGFFGLPVARAEAFVGEARVWQAAIYYRFIHCRVGDRWWLTEVENWARAYLPLRQPVSLPRLHAALAEYQEILAAAGMLSLPRGYNRVNATITDDLTTLSRPPDPAEVLRLTAYRKTLGRQ